MILGHKDIIEAYHNGDVIISPYDETNVGPNSYDVTLNNKLRIYRNSPLDMKSENQTEVLTITESGVILKPNILYIGATNETATSNKYVPMFEGRSSIGRLGISTHVTAGFGDVGFGYIDGVCQYPTWTLEISVIEPIKVYPNVRIGQVYFLKLLSEPDKFYQGKYSCQKETQPSMLFKDKEFE
jgi:dCTP deaminase